MARPRARRTSPLYLPSAFDLFPKSRDLFLDNINVFGLLYILPFFFWIRSWMWIPAGSGHYFDRFSDANYSWSVFPTSYLGIFIDFSVVWMVFTLIVGTAVGIMLQRAQLDAVEGRKPDIERGWALVNKHGLKLLELYVILWLMIGGGIILGVTVSPIFYILAIPEVLMLRRYLFAPYVMIEKKCGVLDAMNESARLSQVNPGAVWGLIGVTVLICLLGIVPIIGSFASFVLGALYSVAPALRYQQLKKLG